MKNRRLNGLLSKSYKLYNCTCMKIYIRVTEWLEKLTLCLNVI